MKNKNILTQCKIVTVKLECGSDKETVGVIVGSYRGHRAPRYQVDTQHGLVTVDEKDIATAITNDGRALRRGRGWSIDETQLKSTKRVAKKSSRSCGCGCGKCR